MDWKLNFTQNQTKMLNKCQQFIGEISSSWIYCPVPSCCNSSSPCLKVDKVDVKFDTVNDCVFHFFLTRTCGHLSTFTTQNAKRTFWNACSERRGVFSGFMDPRSVRILFLLPAKRIHSSTWSFSRSFQAVQEQNLQALTCTILLKPGKKRIRLWPAERFLKALKKGSVFGLPSAF